MSHAIKTTAAACSRQTCEGCEVQGDLFCLHTPKVLLDFVLLAVVWMIPFLAGMIIGKFWGELAIWIGLTANGSEAEGGIRHEQA